VTAVVVPKAGVSLGDAELQGLCKERLAGFKVPKFVVTAGELPKNPDPGG
jgi:fatty-acyl-CoA synthase